MGQILTFGPAPPTMPALRTRVALLVARALENPRNRPGFDDVAKHPRATTAHFCHLHSQPPASSVRFDEPPCDQVVNDYVGLSVQCLGCYLPAAPWENDTGFTQ